MTARLIIQLDDVTTDWLTAVLTSSGALTQGRVRAFSAEKGGGNWSNNARLTLEYSADAQGACPTALFLKLVDTDTGDGEFFLPAEVTYYLRDYRDVADAPLLRCYDAVYVEAQQRYHLLLDDVSATHRDARHLTPTLAHGHALVEGFAALHARWWGISPALHDEAHIRRIVAIAQPGIVHVMRLFSADLKPHWPDLIETIFAKLPDLLIRRSQDSANLTLIHGDPNGGNIMVPIAGDRPIYLIDRQPFDWSLTTWNGAYDLAYAMGLFWRTSRRRELEMPLLRHYHAHLIQRGVHTLTWAQLYDDYRLCMALCVTNAVEYVRGGGDPRWHEFVLRLLQRTLTACDDLNCHDLWRDR
jgi:hypothetical protein